jgi:hypothetical protein
VLLLVIVITLLLAQLESNGPSPKLVRINHTRSPYYDVSEEAGLRKVIVVACQALLLNDNMFLYLSAQQPTSGAKMPDIDGLSFDSQGTMICRRLHYWNWLERPLAPGPISDHHDGRHVSVSAFHARKYHRYITVEFFSGFNNLRMQLEIIFVIAHVLNRTLVLPPKEVISHNERPSLIEDFWDIKDMRKAIRVLTWREYAEEVGVPPSDIDDVPKFSKHFELKAAQSNMLPNWAPLNSVLMIPSIRACKERSNHAAYKFPSVVEFATKDRIQKLIELNSSYFTASHLHFMTRFDRKPPYRLFGLYYAFIYFADVRWHSYYVRLVRKYLHYRAEIANAASLMINHILHDNPLFPGFVSLHIRRGDFKLGYTSVMNSIENIIKEYAPLLERDKPSPREINRENLLYKIPLYLSTDESNFSYFDPLRAGFRVYQQPQLRKVLEVARLQLTNNTANSHLMWVMQNPDMLGPIEQMVCMGGKSFLGTMYSTFTAYIHRLRAHYPSDLALIQFHFPREMSYDRKIYFQHLPYLPEDGNLSLMSWATPGSWDPVNHGHPGPIWGREFIQGLYPLDY